MSINYQKNKGQTVLLLALITGIVLVFLISIYHEASIKVFSQNIRYNQISIARSAFEKAAKYLRYLYYSQATCNPQLFAQAVSALPNPAVPVGSTSLDPNLCDPTSTGSCRAIEISSPLEVGRFPASMYVLVGLVSFSRVDQPCDQSPAVPAIDDFGNNCTGSIPQSAAGVHLRTVLNNIKFDQWVVLLDTCSTMQVPAVGSTQPGVGFGTGWQLGSALIYGADVFSDVGVFAKSGACSNGTMGNIKLIDFRRYLSFIDPNNPGLLSNSNLDCLDLNQDGVIDERDLNVFEKYLMGWLPTIPVRWNP